MKKKVFLVFLIAILGGMFFSTTKTVSAACAPVCTDLQIDCANQMCSSCDYCAALTPGPANNNSYIKNPLLSEDMNRLTGTTFLQKVITLVIELLFVGGTIIFFIMLLSGGIRWIASGGDKTQLEGAKGQITHALIGLVILFSAFAIIKLIGYLFSIDLLNLTLPTL